MTVLEMHISLDNILQRISSFAYGNLTPEQRDFFLNKATLSFIRGRTRRDSNRKAIGFEEDQIALDQIEELVKTIDMKHYIDNDERVYSELPVDYFHLINCRTLVTDYSCITSSIPSPLSLPLHYSTVPFPKDLSAPYYSDLKIEMSINSVITTLFDSSSYPFIVSGGIVEEDMYFYIINRILEDCNSKGIVSVKWQKAYGMYANNSLYFHADFAYDFIRITLNGDVTDFPATQKSRLQQIGDVSLSYRSDSRIIKHNKIAKALDFTFNKTIPTSPVFSVEGRQLFGYYGKRFIMSESRITYIRRPVQVDINLNINSEIKPVFHDDIVRMAAQEISATINSETYSNLLNENLINE